MFKNRTVKHHANTPHQQGLSLIEILVAIGVVMAVVTAMIVAANNASRTANDSRAKAVADQYARMTLEVVRMARDSGGWNALIQAPVPSPEPTTMAINDYRTFSVNQDDLKYELSLINSQTDNPLSKFLCKEIRNAKYSERFKVNNIEGYYRAVTLERRDTGTVRITATICYNYSDNNNRYSSIDEKTYLTDWQ